MPTMKISRILVPALLLVVAAGCHKESPIDGIGPYRVGKTTLGDWGYACNPPDDKGRTFCQSNPLERTHAFKLGEQNALIGAIFKGTDKATPLAELELYVSECQVESLKSWLRHTFGAADEDNGEKMFWRKKLLFIAAKVPPGATECYVNLTDVKDVDRIAELRQPSK